LYAISTTFLEASTYRSFVRKTILERSIRLSIFAIASLIVVLSECWERSKAW